MQNFVFENPTKIVFGRGQIKKIGCEAAKFGKKVFMVYVYSILKRSGVYYQVVASL